jgi:hypothetical protein
MDISVAIPTNYLPIIKSLNKNYQDFVLEAITEKIEREKELGYQNLLMEGYLNSYKEDGEISKEFEISDFEAIK